jgi:hypothetical protein
MYYSIHGGAWAIPDNLAHASVEGVKIAARVGFDILKRGVFVFLKTK